MSTVQAGPRQPQEPTAQPVGIDALAAHLATRSDAELAALLACRADLARPPSASFAALAARAGSRPSVETALAGLDAPTLAVAEAVVALGGTDPGEIAAALDLPGATVGEGLSVLRRLMLILDAGPVPGLSEAFGPHPFGLGPVVPAGDGSGPPPALAELHARTSSPSETGGNSETGGKYVASDPTVTAIPEIPGAPGRADADGPAAGRDPAAVSQAGLAVLDALAWGPPVGTVRTGHLPAGAAELVERGWLQRTSDAAGRTRVILPRAVGLALRGGRLMREGLAAPDPGELAVQGAAAVADQSSRQAEEAVRLVAALLAAWRHEGGAVLRSGGVGVRALARTADTVGIEPQTAATLLEAAAAADLLGLDDSGAAWVPSCEAAAWAEGGVPQRWAPLAVAWASSARTPWLVGTRNDDGSLRPVLGEDVEAPWARLLRRRILDLLAGLEEGTVVTPAWVRAALTFARPRRIVPAGAVSAVLAEAELLGLTGGGALSRAGRVLAGSSPPDVAEGVLREGAPEAPSGSETPGASIPAADLLVALEEALAADLPAPVDLLLVQSDLTAIVPGRPVPELAEVLERAAVVESRGGALTVRFTAESLRGALDSGWSAAEVRQGLERFTPTALPVALTALLDDAARHHGSVRVRDLACLLTADEATAAGIVADDRLGELGLSPVAPGVVAATASASRVLSRLRAIGLAPVLEDASGRLLLADQPETGRGGASPEPARPGSSGTVRRRRPTARELAGQVARLRAAQQALEHGAGQAALSGGGASDPVHVLALLRQAQADRSRLRLRLAGVDGAILERRVRVLAVEAGRVRLADVVRETELTAAVHRIVSVEAD